MSGDYSLECGCYMKTTGLTVDEMRCALHSEIQSLRMQLKTAEEKAEGEFAIGSSYHKKWQKAEEQLDLVEDRNVAELAMEIVRLRRTVTDVEKGAAHYKEIYDLVDQCFTDESNGYDALASASWDRVRELFKARKVCDTCKGTGRTQQLLNLKTGEMVQDVCPACKGK